MADIAIGLGSYTTTDVASAATCNIGAATTLKVKITGTTGITSFGTSANRIRFIEFEDALILTYNATSLKLPTSANITTAAGDTATAMSDASGNWTITNYQRRTGLPVAGAAALATYLDSRAGVWGDPIATANFSSGVAVVDFTGLSAYRELLLVGFNVTHGDAAGQNMILRLSDDAGSVYDATGYTSTGTTVASGFPVALSMAQSTAFDFEAHIIDFNNATYKARCKAMAGRNNASATVTWLGGRYGTARVNDALRLTTALAVNFTAYELLLYGRKG